LNMGISQNLFHREDKDKNIFHKTTLNLS
jgi:hypothetical protein